MKKNLIIFFLLLFQLSNSQKESNIWYFGPAGFGLDFNSCEPKVISNGARTTEVTHGNGSISDSSGNLLFYTNGITVWNRNRLVMSNGTGLDGNVVTNNGISSKQSLMIVKRPGNYNQYYIFTLEEQSVSKGLKYSVVNMDENNGLGVVFSKNNSLINSTSEQIHATRHANGEDIWVSVYGLGNKNFYSFLVTSSGVSLSPVVSSIDGSISEASTIFAGEMKFSPNGEKLAIGHLDDGVSLLDFDNNTGLFSNVKNVTSRSNCHGIEFSPSGDILYVNTILGNDHKLFQYRLTTSNISSSERVIYDNDEPFHSLFSLQLGPDKKIYALSPSRISVINSPENIGTSCDYVKNIFTFSNWSGTILPSFVQPFFDNEILFENACFADTTTFKLKEGGNTITWNFGDPDSGVNNTSTNLEPFHVFSDVGTYTVTATIPSECNSNSIETIEYEVKISALPSINNKVELVQCDDDLDGYSYFNLFEANEKLSSNFANETFSFYETFENAEKGVDEILNPNNYFNEVKSSDTIWVRVENSNGCFEIAEINLIVVATQIPSGFNRTIYACDDNEIDGVGIFDFTSVVTDIDNLFPINEKINITYYRNLSDALAENDPINILSYENIGYPYTQDIFVRVDSEINNNCLGLGHHLTLKVLEQPQFDLDENLVLCIEGSNPNIKLNTTNPFGSYDYKWVNKNDKNTILGTESYLTVNEGGIYSVIATYDYGTNLCESYSHEVNVIESRAPIITLEMIDIVDNSTNNTILINEALVGSGDYEYSLDNEFGLYQDNPSFKNVIAGVHTIYAREKYNCASSSLEISIIGYPKFFTPNNDNKNEKWNIKGLSSNYTTSSKISIYNRYGKLIKQIAIKSDGWDGTFNGELLPNSDYWFVAQLVNFQGETRVIKGHFALKR